MTAIVSRPSSSLRFENVDGIIRTMAASPSWLDALLIQADLGPTLASKIRRELQSESGRFGLARKEELRRALRAQLIGLLSSAEEFVPCQRPSVILVVGVNGSGKTTTIAKLAHRFRTHRPS